MESEFSDSYFQDLIEEDWQNNSENIIFDLAQEWENLTNEAQISTGFSFDSAFTAATGASTASSDQGVNVTSQSFPSSSSSLVSPSYFLSNPETLNPSLLEGFNTTGQPTPLPVHDGTGGQAAPLPIDHGTGGFLDVAPLAASAPMSTGAKLLSPTTSSSASPETQSSHGLSQASSPAIGSYIESPYHGSPLAISPIPLGLPTAAAAGREQKRKASHPNRFRSGQKGQAQTSRAKALIRDTAPKTEFKRDQSGTVVGVFKVFGLKSNVRTPYNSEARKSTALRRKLGVCDRCRKFRQRCEMPENPYMPCQRCSLVSSAVLRQPCIRVSLLDLSLHRLGSTKDNELYDWIATKEKLAVKLKTPESLQLVERPRELFLTQDFGFQLQVTVSKFHVTPRDKTAYPWEDKTGAARELEMPPYYIIDMQACEKRMKEYCRDSYTVYILRLLGGSDPSRGGSHPIVCETFQEAIHFSDATNNQLVRSALQLWAASRLTERPWRICGTETLGMEPISHLDSPWSGIVPVTPVMDTQLDHLVIHSLLNPLRKSVLEQLQDKISRKKREDWIEIYLAMFVLMHNMERQFAQVLFFMKFYGVKKRFRAQSNTSVSEGFVHACKTLLAYFHHVWNGQAPLTLAWGDANQRGSSSKPSSSSVPPGTVTDEQVDFLARLTANIQLSKPEMEGLKSKSMYETELYWCHQLLLPDCQVHLQNDHDMDELREDDYILHWTSQD